MIKIGDLAKICNVGTQTLRFYDAEGVLKPDIVDQSSGYRFYSLDAVEKYKQIIFYKNLGFSLDEIKKIQSVTDGEIRDLLDKKKASLLQTINRIRDQIKTIDGICEGNNKKPLLSELLLLPFEDDPQVIGKWQLCGKLLDENDPVSVEEVSEEKANNEIIFMPGGAFVWDYFWTKGILYRLSTRYSFAIPSPYRTFEQNGERYMIVQFMTDDCIDKGEDNLVLLYRQVDNTAYTELQIRTNVDKTDLPFVEDEDVRGDWVTCDFVHEISDFDPSVRHISEDKIFTLSISFASRGICTRMLRSRSGGASYMLRYTKGFVIDNKEMTTEEYQMKTINGKEYLFVEHKSGDYIYGGMKPHWYVFERMGE